VVKFSLSIDGCFTLRPSLGMIACEYPDKLYLFRNWKECPTRSWKPRDRIFILPGKTLECDGRTDRRTDGRNHSGIN